jgi:hypothetical protein
MSVPYEKYGEKNHERKTKDERRTFNAQLAIGEQAFIRLRRVERRMKRQKVPSPRWGRKGEKP